jgi:hypothetical protein
MKNKIIGIVAFLAVCFSNKAHSQIWLTMDSLFKGSPYIFEGTVLNADSSFIAGPNDWIFTAHKVKVEKVIRGNLQCGSVEIVTVGGTVNGITGYESDGLQLSPNASGIFLCLTSEWPSIGAPRENPIPLSVFADRQGFFPYGVEYANNPNPLDDSALAYWDGTQVKFFTSHEMMLDYFQKKLGYGYTSCGLSENDIPTKFNWYPTPSNNFVNLSIPGTEQATVCLYDITGRIVMQLDASNSISHELKLNGFKSQIVQQIDLSGLRSGTYIGKASSGSNIYNFKLIKL